MNNFMPKFGNLDKVYIFLKKNVTTKMYRKSGKSSIY